MRFFAPVFFLLLCTLLCTGAFGQEEQPPAANPDSQWAGFVPVPYSRGDQTFNINLGICIPLFFVEQEKGMLEKKMNMGGMLALSYNYFLSPHFFIGGELAGMFAGTVAKNNYYIVPFGFRGGYQFTAGRFEFPLSLLVGAAAQSRLGDGYFGFFAKPSAAVFFRFNHDWSFGLNTSFWWVPQWTSYTNSDFRGKINVHGFFLEITAGVRYHF